MGPEININSVLRYLEDVKMGGEDATRKYIEKEMDDEGDEGFAVKGLQDGRSERKRGQGKEQHEKEDSKRRD